MNEKELLYWNNYLRSINIGTKAEPYVETSIAGNIDIANSLLSLYLSGKKYAGSGLVKDYQLAGDELPKIGNHWIVLDAKGTPCCILKTIRVETHLFKNITKEIAIAEGEGDLSIETWKKLHRKFFTPYLQEFKIDNLDDEPIITEFYELVYTGAGKVDLTV